MDLFTISNNNKNINSDNLSSVKTSSSNKSILPMTDELSATSTINKSIRNKNNSRTSSDKKQTINKTLSGDKSGNKSSIHKDNQGRTTSVRSVTLASSNSSNSLDKSKFYGGSFDSSMPTAGIFMDDSIIKKLERVAGRTNQMMRGGRIDTDDLTTSDAWNKSSQQGNYVPFNRNTTSLLRSETSPMYSNSNKSNSNKSNSNKSNSNDITDTTNSTNSTNSTTNDDNDESISDISSETESTITFGEDGTRRGLDNKWRYTTSSGWDSNENSDLYSDTYTENYTESDTLSPKFNSGDSSSNSNKSGPNVSSKYISSNSRTKSNNNKNRISSKKINRNKNKKKSGQQLDSQKEYINKHIKNADYLMSESDLFTATG